MTAPLFDTAFAGYAYSYPHKHSYRRLGPLSLRSLWAEEKKDALFLYVHLPFCEMRCGFCNLFTMAHPPTGLVDAYLDTLALEAATVRELAGPEQFAQMAVGGGTPTFLDLSQLDKLFTIVRQLGADPTKIPVSVETSPGTLTREKLDFLVAQGVDRISMGIQSFLESEVKALGRPQKNSEVYATLDLLKQYPFATLNIDLIYGAYGQSLSSWQHSVREAIRYEVDEIFIYPLYVRPLTGITKLSQVAADERPSLYQAARQLLQEAGYQQVSMRMFRRSKGSVKASAPRYSCQEDGMIGLGAGARSYTRAVHYSAEYAVARHNIKSIVEKYQRRSTEDFHTVDYGIVLTADEQKRRYIIKSILHSSGLQTDRYRSLYGREVIEEFPELQQLIDHGLAQQESDMLRLTDRGIGYSDAIGPWLYSQPIQQLINDFTLH
jgi:oxygen-independent coproporphyrinogen-3 oxidase